MRKVFSILFCFVFFFSTLYFLWTTTPLFAFQEAIFALKDHDRETFEKRVDVDGLVRSLVEDLLVKPALPRAARRRLSQSFGQLFFTR